MTALWRLGLGLLGCAQDTPLVATGRPTSAEGVVLLATISPLTITVHGVLDGVPQHVDIDAGLDERYGFRYRVRDADGELLYERSTVGPALVEGFLQYWSGVSGFAILDSVPTLGRFPLTVPLLPGASYVELEVRNDVTGEYTLRGRWDYERLADPRIEVDPTIVTGTELLVDSGDPAHRLDIVIVPDGYRAEDLAQFRADADLVANRIVGTEPFTTYADRLNIVRLDVESAEAGASYDCPTCGIVDNAFGSIFPIEFVNRATGSTYETRAVFQAEQWRVAEALAGVPWDAVIVLVNTEAFGGMAVHYAVVTRGVGGIGPTAVHELGHSFGMLGDEYVFDDCIRSPKLGLPENITDRPRNPPWPEYVADGTPLPTPPGDGFAIGAYPGAWNCPDLYRPAESCRMNEGGLFCAVCSELLVRRLLRYGDPAEQVTIDGRDLQITGALPDTTVLVWADDEVVGVGTPAAPPRVPRGAERVTVELTHHATQVARDPTNDLRETWEFAR